MDMADEYDLIVIGGGSGGLACAQRATEYGARVLLAESGRLGGTCVNVGCVPKKVMWNAAEIAHAVRDAADYGFEIPPGTHDWAALKKVRDAYVERLNAIYERNLAARHVELVRGFARFTGPHSIEVAGREARAKHVVIATGGRPMLPKMAGAELGITSDGFFELERRPERIFIAGSGYVAVELAGIFSSLGTHVMLATRGDTVLRSFDAMLGEACMTHMREAGVEIVPNARPGVARRASDGALELVLGDGRYIGPVDCILWAIGREAHIDGLGLERAGVELDAAGNIRTDKYQTTNVPGVHAIGDVTGRLLLTPVAIAAGRRLSDRLFGGQVDRYLDYDNVATVIFGHPPIGTVGLTEAVARMQYGEEVKVFTSSFVPLYHALTTRKPRVQMKLITVGSAQRIVGLHVIGEGADEMTQGFAVAMHMGATKRDFDDTVAIHPTSAEEFVTMR
jgi:glutathione reductase (NADPH)